MTIFRAILITIFSMILGFGLLFFGLLYFVNLKNDLVLQGEKTAIQSIISEVNKNGGVIFQGVDKDGKKVEIVLKAQNGTQEIKK